MLAAIAYIIEYILKDVMLPGQVENWIIINDLNNMSFWNMPLQVNID